MTSQNLILLLSSGKVQTTLTLWAGDQEKKKYSLKTKQDKPKNKNKTNKQKQNKQTNK